LCNTGDDTTVMDDDIGRSGGSSRGDAERRSQSLLEIREHTIIKDRWHRHYQHILCRESCRQRSRLGGVQVMHLPSDVAELIGRGQAGTHPLYLALHQHNPTPHTGLTTPEEDAV
jgi:hypothetical protein